MFGRRPDSRDSFRFLPPPPSPPSDGLFYRALPGPGDHVTTEGRAEQTNASISVGEHAAISPPPGLGGPILIRGPADNIAERLQRDRPIRSEGAEEGNVVMWEKEGNVVMWKKEGYVEGRKEMWSCERWKAMWS